MVHSPNDTTVNIGYVGVRWCTVGVPLVYRWCSSIVGMCTSLWTNCTNYTTGNRPQPSLSIISILYRKLVGGVGVGVGIGPFSWTSLHLRGLVQGWCSPGGSVHA